MTDDGLIMFGSSCTPLLRRQAETLPSVTKQTVGLIVSSVIFAILKNVTGVNKGENALICASAKQPT